MTHTPHPAPFAGPPHAQPLAQPLAQPHGPRLRADVVDVYIVRGHRPASPAADSPQLLLLKRDKPPLLHTWHPVMGHIEPGERAWQAAAREALEETALDVWKPPCAGFFALEQVHPFYIASLDCLVLSPRFLALVDHPWEPTLNHEHSAARWVPLDRAHQHLTWPGQRATLAEILHALTPTPHTEPSTLDLLRLPPPTP